MKKWLLLLAVSLAGNAFAQKTAASMGVTRSSVAAILGFEGPPGSNGGPAGWFWPGEPLTVIDTQIVHGGKQSARIERTSASPGTFTTITSSLPIDFGGRSVELRGYLRVEGVQGDEALWLREGDADRKVLSFQNSEPDHFAGTSDWKQFSVRIPLQGGGKTLSFGVLLSGTGRAWADDLELLVDEQPLAKASQAEPPVPTILDRDLEFANGSKIQLSTLSDAQVESLATLAEVWGFLKYHHPSPTGGQRNWDFELFRVMPKILAARNRDEVNGHLLRWIDSLGALRPCSPCAQLDTQRAQVAPDVAWLGDRKRFGAALSDRLVAIYAARSGGEQFYAGVDANIGNVQFLHEPDYKAIAFPDAGFQLLTLFRWWNAVEWWYPDRLLLPDLHQILRAHIRAQALAKNRHEFTLETIRLIAEARDSHANLWSSLDDRPPMGKCRVQADLRSVGDDAVVWNPSAEAAGLQRGDVVESIDGTAVAALVKEWLPFYAGSNSAARKRDLANQLLYGSCGPVAVTVRRNGPSVRLALQRVHPLSGDLWRHDLGGEPFRLLSKDVAYVELGTANSKDVGTYLEQAAATRGMIVDCRNYPKDFVLETVLAQSFVTAPIVFARFTGSGTGNPGAFHFLKDASIAPGAPHYSGKVVLLVDEVTQSAAEYATMMLRSAPGAIVVGSQTAGADGNVSRLPLPFGMNTLLSGIGVLTPRNAQTQQVGIARDVDVRPTIAGMAAGRDEVLEAAIRQIVGTDVSEENIETMAHRQ